MSVSINDVAGAVVAQERDWGRFLTHGYFHRGARGPLVFDLAGAFSLFEPRLCLLQLLSKILDNKSLL